MKRVTALIILSLILPIPVGIILAVLTDNPKWLWLCSTIILFMS